MKYILCLLMLIGALKSYTQSSLKGKITDELQKPVEKATVTLIQKSNSKNLFTDSAGIFEFTQLSPGRYNLLVSCQGFENYSASIVIPKDQQKDITIQLNNYSSLLQSVEIIGRNSRKYNSEYSFGATRTAVRNQELPLAMGTVTKELMNDRQAFQLADAAKNIAGVIPSSYYNQYAIRGISQNEEGQIVNGMRTRQYYFLQPITSNIERVEVLKGPASATFSSVDPGGSLNLVTKKPLKTDRKEISLSAGSFSTIRGTLDFTGPLNKEQTLLYRLNGAYQEARSFRDLVRNNSILVSPSFSYIPNAQTAINAEIILSNMNGNLDRGQPIFGAQAGVTSLGSTPKSLNLGASNDFFKSKEFIITGNLSHQFSQAIGFNFSYMKQTWTEDLQEHRTTGAFAVDINNQPVASLAAMQLVQRKQHWNIDNINSYFTFRAGRGKISSELLVGYDLHSWQKLKGGGQNAGRGFLLKSGAVTNSFVLANAGDYQTITYNGNTLPRPNIPHFDLSNPLYTVRNINDYILNVRTALPAALTTTHSLYIQEQFKWKKWFLLLSLRQEWFRDITNHDSPGEQNFKNSKLLPRIGLSYEVIPQMNIYLTYLEGFQPQSNTVTLMPNTGNFFNTAKSASLFKPLESDLKEAGIKLSFLQQKLQVNAAVYEINQRNLLLNANLPAYPDSLVTRGAEKSRGFEVEATGFLLPNLQVNAFYSYIDARVVEDNDPGLKNARKQNTPYNSAGLWVRFNFPGQSRLKHIGIGGGFQHSGNKIPWFTRAFTVPGYTVADMAVYYTPGKSNMQVSLNLNNVFNNSYWIGAQNYLRLFPGAPRNFLLTITYKF